MTPSAQLIARNSALAKVTLAAALNLVLPTDGQAPEWIELFPPGRDVKGVDGRAWINDKPQAVVDAFKAGGRPLPIDQDHALDLAARIGGTAPAAGWIEELQVREGGSIWGRVAWTPPGAELVKTRQYRFISPAFMYDRNSTRIARLASAALTNQPNLRMTALNAAQSETEIVMFEKILALLGLDKSATEEQALAAVKKLKDEHATALNSVAQPPLDKFVPRADYDKQVELANSAQSALKANNAKALDSEIDAEIKTALDGKKITPATVEYHKAQCRQEGGLARFKEFVKAAPVIAADSKLGNEDPAKGGGTGLTSDQLAMCSAMGITPENYKKQLA